MTQGMRIQVDREIRRSDELRGDLMAIEILLRHAKYVRDFATKKKLWNAHSRLTSRVSDVAIGDAKLWHEVIALAVKGTRGI